MSVTSHVGVSPAGPDAAWKSPTTVTVTVVVMAALLFAVFMSIVHWRPDVCQTYFRKEPIPNFLVSPISREYIHKTKK